MSKPDFVLALSYFHAARDRAADARLLHEGGRPGAAVWIAGIALESLFRSLVFVRTNQLDTGHNLRELRNAALSAVPTTSREKVAAAVAEVINVWRHSDRYTPEGEIADRLASRRNSTADRSERIVNAVLDIMNEGALQWKNLRR